MGDMVLFTIAFLVIEAALIGYAVVLWQMASQLQGSPQKREYRNIAFMTSFTKILASTLVVFYSLVIIGMNVYAMDYVRSELSPETTPEAPTEEAPVMLLASPTIVDNRQFEVAMTPTPLPPTAETTVEATENMPIPPTIMVAPTPAATATRIEVAFCTVEVDVQAGARIRTAPHVEARIMDVEEFGDLLRATGITVIEGEQWYQIAHAGEIGWTRGDVVLADENCPYLRVITPPPLPVSPNIPATPEIVPTITDEPTISIIISPPTVEPTATQIPVVPTEVIGVIISPVPTTPVATIEVTPSPTSIATIEITPTITPESTSQVRIEITPEVTVEPTLEATPEVTEAPTPEVTEATPEPTEIIRATATIEPTMTATAPLPTVVVPTITVMPSPTTVPSGYPVISIVSPAVDNTIVDANILIEAVAYDASISTVNGTNIAYVIFEIYAPNGTLIHRRQENIVRYCAGTGDADCSTITALASYNQNGLFRIRAMAVTQTGFTSQWVERTFIINPSVQGQPVVPEVAPAIVVPDVMTNIVPVIPTALPVIEVTPEVGIK